MKYCIFNRAKNKFEQLIQDSEQDDQMQSQSQVSYEVFQAEQNLSAIPAVTWDNFFTPIKFSMTLQQPFSGMTPTDTTLLWAVIPPSLQSRSAYFTFRKGQIVVENWNIVTPPTVIYIGVDGITGYLDQNANTTTRLARYIMTGLIQSGTLFSATYELLQSPAWSVPLALASMNFRVYFDDNVTPIQLPLPFQISLSVQFRRYVSPYSQDLVNLSPENGFLMQQ